MKTTNFVLLYYFLFLSVSILVQTTPNHFKEVPGGKSVYNNQRILQEDDYQNYIIITYSKEVTYTKANGFNCYLDQYGENYRGEIDNIKYKNKEYSMDQSLKIEANTEVQIHFNRPISSLESYFDSFYCEPNVEHINSVDFSNFDSSSLESIHYLFYRCYELKYVNFQNFDTSKVIYMNNMFY